MEYKRGIKQEIPVGTRYGKLVVIGEGEKFTAPCGKSYRGIMCQCDCGVVKNIRARHLRTGAVLSCGCLRPRRIIQNKRLHGQWGGMILRCENPKTKEYDRYGERGISICSEWRNSYNTFAQWALENGWSDKLLLDRIDNDGNYCPENCRFVEPWLSVANRSVAKMVEFDGKQVSFSILLHELNLIKYYKTIEMRMRKGRTALGAIIMQYHLNKKKSGRGKR